MMILNFMELMKSHQVRNLPPEHLITLLETLLLIDLYSFLMIKTMTFWTPLNKRRWYLIKSEIRRFVNTILWQILLTWIDWYHYNLKAFYLQKKMIQKLWLIQTLKLLITLVIKPQEDPPNLLGCLLNQIQRAD